MAATYNCLNYRANGKERERTGKNGKERERTGSGKREEGRYVWDSLTT
jgi:hypothetical protein